MTVRMDDLLDGHPLERMLRASLLEFASGPWLDALGVLRGIERRRRAMLRQPHTALPLLGPWAPHPPGPLLQTITLWYPGGRVERVRPDDLHRLPAGAQVVPQRRVARTAGQRAGEVEP
jgi:hypothetical protein